MSYARCAVLYLTMYCMVAVAAAQEIVPGFNPAQCPAIIQKVAHDHQALINCGWFVVPEDRQTPENGRLVELLVARIRSLEQSDNSPLLHLAGGPGDAATDDLAFWLESRFHQDYDIILLDQRGTGLSRPSLDCPEIDSYNQWIRACRARLIDEGIDLSAYHTMAVVWDVRDLLETLDIKQVNLYGNSFGSRLALLLAAVAPERVRSMVLDGVYPPSRSDVVEMACNTEQALERLFDDCETTPACNLLIPELRHKFYQVVTDMNEEPPELNNKGENTGFFMTGDEFLLWTATMLRYADAIPMLSLLIEGFYRGNYDLLLLINAFAKAPYWNEEDTHSEGAYYSVRCAEDLTLAVSERWQAEHKFIREEIVIALSPIVRNHFSECEVWDVRPAPEQIMTVVTSVVPTLLLSGAYDPATPPHWAEFAAESLKTSWHYVFPAASHGVLQVEPCAILVMQNFLADPRLQPTDDCVGELRPPVFSAPLNIDL